MKSVLCSFSSVLCMFLFKIFCRFYWCKHHSCSIHIKCIMRLGKICVF